MMGEGIPMTTEWLSGPWVRGTGIVVIGVITWVLLRHAMRRFRQFLVDRSQDDEHDRRIVTVMRVIKHLVGILLIVVVLTLVFAELGLSLAPVLGTAGIVGVALGLAAQSIAKDVLSGLALLVDNQIRVGDDVEIAGKNGVIEELSLRTIRLRDWNGEVHFIRTGQIDTVTNKSVGFGYATLDIEIAEQSDVAKAEEAIRRAAADVSADPELGGVVLDNIDVAGVERWASDALVIRARLKVKPPAQNRVRRKLLALTRERLTAAGIDSPVQRLVVRGDQHAATVSSTDH
jgi:small-conductance mechanosensitive channel